MLRIKKSSMKYRDANGNMQDVGAVVGDNITPVDNMLSTTSTNPVQNKVVTKALESIKASGVQQVPLFANNVDECTDTSKVYVLPDGYIYAYMESGKVVYTNLFSYDNALDNLSRISGSTEDMIYDTLATWGYKDVANKRFVSLKSVSDGRFAITGGLPDLPAGTYTVSAEVFVPSSASAQTVTFGVCMIPSNKQAYTEYTISKKETWEKISYTFTVPESDLYTYVATMSGKGYTSEIYWRNIEVISANDKGTTVPCWNNTGRAFIPADYEDRIVELENAVDRANADWTGKKWVAVGDSLTQEIASDGTNANTDKYYHTHISEATGITVVNMGQGGTGYMKTQESGYAFYHRISSVPTDADVITIMGSLNDLSRTASYTMGEVTDTGTSTICGCINTTLDNLFSRFPLANVGIITPVPNDYYNYFNMATDDKALRIVEYCEKLTEICHRRSIPVLDMFHESGMRPWDTAFKNAFMPDGTHGNEAGHKILATKIKAFLETLL